MKRISYESKWISKGWIILKHALVIEGTGMLAQASVWLSENGYHVSVIGRNAEKMQVLLDENPTRMTPVLVDYTNRVELMEQLHRIQNENGPIQLVVAWIHSTGQHVIPCLSASLSHSQPWKLFHVSGSSSNLQEIKDKTAIPTHVSYHQIQLGFITESEISRWLTHAEISNGVIKAILEDEPVQIIGTIEPWENRP